jgi:hypothetical protein
VATLGALSEHPNAMAMTQAESEQMERRRAFWVGMFLPAKTNRFKVGRVIIREINAVNSQKNGLRDALARVSLSRRV